MLIIKRTITTVLLGLALMLSALSATAQTYSFDEPTTGTFTSIRYKSEAVKVELFGGVPDADNGLFNPIHIGFEFYLFGEPIETLVPTSNIWLSTDPNYQCNGPSCFQPVLNNNSTFTAGIYPFWTDGYATTDSRVHYLRSGNVGSRELTIEFSRFRIVANDTVQDDISVQVKLFEDNSKIVFVYQQGDASTPTPSDVGVAVGLAASSSFLSGSDTGRYYSLNNYGTDAMGSNSDTAITNISARDPPRPANGQTYTFTPNLYLPPVEVIIIPENTDISVILPEALHVTGMATYTLTGPPASGETSPGPLPTGFNWDAPTRTFSGESPERIQFAVLTYSVTDDLGTALDPSDDVTESRDFLLQVVAEAFIATTAFAPNTTITPIRVIANDLIEPVTLPQPLSVRFSYTYSITPQLPLGVFFDHRNRVLTGTPTVSMDTETFTYTATNIVGQSASLMFTITVEPEPDTQPVAPTPADLMRAHVFEPGDVVDITLAPFTGGNAPLTHSLTDESGTVIDASTSTLITGSNLMYTPADETMAGMITGMIAADMADVDDSEDAVTYTYTATDADMDAVPVDFTIAVVDPRPEAPVSIPSNARNLLHGQLIDSAGITLPPFTYIADNVTTPTPLTVTLTPGIPGLTFAANQMDRTITITGTPNTTDTLPVSYPVIYKATDDTDSAQIMFDIVVSTDPRPVAPANLVNLVVRPGQVLPNDVNDPMAVVLPEFPFPDAPEGTMLTYQFALQSAAEADITALMIGDLTTLTFVPSTRLIHGTVPREAGNASLDFIYSAIDDDATPDNDMDDDKVDANFTITVVDSMPVPPTGTQDLMFEAGRVSTQTLEPFTGGDSPLTYAIGSGNTLPNWVSVTSNMDEFILTGTFPGTATNDESLVGTYSYFATDADEDNSDQGDLAAFRINITDAMPMFSQEAEAEVPSLIEVIQNSDILEMTLPEATARPGDLAYETGDLMYSLPGLPDGIMFDPETRVLSGGPTGTPSRTPYFYHVQDGDGDIDTIEFEIEVEEDDPPVAPVPVPPATSFAIILYPGQDLAVDPVPALPVFTGGNGMFEYSLSDAAILMSTFGLTFDAESREFEGMAPVDTDAVVNVNPVTFRYTAKDTENTEVSTDDESAFVDITIAIEDTVPQAPTGSQPHTVTVGMEVTAGTITLNEFTGGDGELMYNTMTDPTLPTGLMLNDDRQITGEIIDSVDDQNDDEPVEYTYFVRDSGGMGDTASATFTLQVVDGIPEAPTGPSQPLVFVPGDPVVVTTGGNGVLLPFTGGNGDLTYAIEVTPDLPLGLSFSATPGSLGLVGAIAADTPNVDDSFPAGGASPTEYTYSASDEGGVGDTATATFTIRIIDPRPQLPLVRRSNIQFTLAEQGDQEQTEELPVFRYINIPGETNNPDLTYTVTGDMALPQGLSFDGTSREIRGTPTAATPDMDPPTFTYRATDGTDSAEYTITITVTDDPAPQAPTIPNGGYTFRVGEMLPPVGDNAATVLPIFMISGSDDSSLMHTLENTSGAIDNVSNQLAGGLLYDSDTRTIYGEVMGDSEDNDDIVTYTYEATETEDPDGQNETGEPVMFTITITDEMPMFAGGASIMDIVGTADSRITSVSLPMVEDEGTTTTEHPMAVYRFEPMLPDGLDFNSARDMIEGTPTSSLTQTTYEYIATDADGDTDPVEFTITIAEDDMPDPLTLTRSAFVFTPGQVLPDTGNMAITLPTTMDGNGMLTYSIRDSSDTEVETLVGGLTFTPDTRVISGTISPIDRVDSDDSIDLTTYTYRATDVDGDFVSAPFTIEVVDPRPDAPSGNLDRTFNIGMDNPYTLPPFTIIDDNDEDVATPTLTYTVTEADGTPRPGWLTFTAATRELSGTPPPETEDAEPLRLTYTASEDGGADRASVTFTLTFSADAGPLEPPTIPNGGYTFAAGVAVNEQLPGFGGGNGAITYSLDDAEGNSVTNLVGGLTFTPNDRRIAGPNADGAGNDSVIATTYIYTATDADDDPVSVNFTITITDEDVLVPPTDPQAFSFEPGEMVSVTLDPHTGGPGDPITYALITTTTPALPGDLALNPTSRVISGTLPDSTMVRTTYTYTATSGNEMHEHTFTIAITDVPSLDEATASALPSVSANIALVASQAISSRVELALDGLSSGIDIRTLDGPQLRLNPQQQSGGSGSPVRFGVWYSAASDSLSDTLSTVTWEGTTDSTNLGFDVGFDISADASLVVGILQNSSSTSATYRNTDSESVGTLSVDLDSTTFYVGLGYDWLDAWFANGSADSTLNDSETKLAIPASFSYQTIGLTASFEIIDSLTIGGKVESLTSDLSLTEMGTDFSGLQTDSSQLRTSFVANYQLELGEKGNGLLIPKFEFGFRDLSLGTTIMATDVTAVGGSAMETGFGVDYIQRAWGLILGLDIRSISVENYSSDSTQYEIHWESGSYGNGLSFQLTPHSVSETLGGIDSLYSGDYNQYQSVLERQRGGNNTADSKGLDFEVGYGFVAGYGTITPYLKTTNYRGSGSRAEEFGIRYQTLSGLELTLRAERSLTPQTVQILGFPLTFTQDENALTFNTRYNF